MYPPYALILIMASETWKLIGWLEIQNNEDLNNGASFFYEMKNFLTCALDVKLSSYKTPFCSRVTFKKSFMSTSCSPIDSHMFGFIHMIAQIFVHNFIHN